MGNDYFNNDNNDNNENEDYRKYVRPESRYSELRNTLITPIPMKTESNVVFN